MISERIKKIAERIRQRKMERNGIGERFGNKEVEENKEFGLNLIKAKLLIRKGASVSEAVKKVFGEDLRTKNPPLWRQVVAKLIKTKIAGKKSSIIGHRPSLLRKMNSRIRMNKIGELRDRIRMLRRKIAESRRPESIVDYADSNIRKDTMYSNFETSKPGVVSGKFGDGASLENLKNEQLKKAPPTLRAEDVRQAMKRAFKLAWKRFAKNLEPDTNVLKAELFDRMIESGVKEKVAVAIIESTFEKVADKFFEQLWKKAEEIEELGDEGIADLEKTIEMTVTLTPEGDVVGEYSEEGTGEVVEEELEDDENIDKELEERLVKGSVNIKTAKKNTTDRDLLKAVVPKYNIPNA